MVGAPETWDVVIDILVSDSAGKQIADVSGSFA